MKKILVSLLVVLLSVNGVFAAITKISDIKCSFDSVGNGYDCIVSYILYFFRVPNIEDYYWEKPSGPPNFLAQIIVPLVALFVITYGFMINIDIFGRKNRWINVVLTVLMIFATIPTGVFGRVIFFVFQWGPRYAFVMWALLFVIGVWSIFSKTRARMGTEAAVAQTKWDLIKEEKNQLKELMVTESELLRQLAGAKAEDKGKIETSLDKIKARIDQIKATISQLERQ